MQGDMRRAAPLLSLSWLGFGLGLGLGLGSGLAALALLRVVPRERPHLSARRDGQRLHLQVDDGAHRRGLSGAHACELGLRLCPATVGPSTRT